MAVQRVSLTQAFVFPVILLLVFSFDMQLFAQQHEPNRPKDFFEMSIEELMEVPTVVSAARIEQPITKAPASVTVVTEEEIRNMGARNLLDVLETVPGLGIAKNRAWEHRIEVRGFHTEMSEKILFMLNGHPLDNNLLNGGCTLVYDNLPVDNVKRIEIIRGPASALYGANAFLALINIITKDGKDIDGVRSAYRTGSFDTHQYNVLFGKAINDFDVALSLNRLTTNGFGAHMEHDAGGTSGHADSWEDIYDADVLLKYKDVKFKGNYRQRKTGPFFGGIGFLDCDETDIDYRVYFLETEYNSKINQNLDFTGRIYYDDHYWNNVWQFLPGDSLYEYWQTCTRIGGEVLGKYRLNEQNRIISGLTLEEHKMFDVGWSLDGADMSDPATNWNGDHNRTVWALYAEDIWNIADNLQLNVGGRYDHYSDFGGILNPRGGIVWEFVEDHYLKLLYGRGFRAPTFGELYNINNPIVIGNPNVDPETVETYEVSLDAKITPNMGSRVSVFHNTIEDLIGIYNFQHANLSGKTKTSGLELELKTFYAKDSYIGANYTYQRTEDADSEELPDVPEHKGNILVNHRLTEKFNLVGHIVFKGKSNRSAGDIRDDVAGFAIVNVALLGKDLIKGLEVQASVRNLFDKRCFDPSPAPGATDYPYMSDYQRPERSYFLEIVYRF